MELVFAALGQRRTVEEHMTFQVTFAEKVQDRFGKTINSFDMIGIDDVLVVAEGGFLSMLDYVGLPVEIDGDAISDIRELNLAIDPARAL